MSRSTLLRGRIGRFLADTYTRDTMSIVEDDTTTVGVDESTGPWGEAITQEGGTQTVSGQPIIETRSCIPCLWVDAGDPILRTGQGVLTLDKPVIFVAFDDPIKTGDQFRDVIDAEGNVRFSGPGVVEATTYYGPPGASVMQIVNIRFAEVT